MKIRESFKFYRRRDIKLDAEKKIISSILKLGENNQYNYPMTKPLPTSCNKQQKKVPTWKEFNLMLQPLDLDYKIRHLFVVDIRFNKEETTPKKYMHNEIYGPIFEKKTILDTKEKSVFQLS